MNERLLDERFPGKSPIWKNTSHTNEKFKIIIEVPQLRGKFETLEIIC